jgi:uncharacterized Ntn-hydrolase superfamily protein
MTFTAVARCPRTGRLGVGMATRAPAVGNRCPIVRPGYGAASVQLIADPRQTMLCGRLLDLGYSATKVLAELEASDPHIVRRQIGIVDSYGNTAAFSGRRATDTAAISWAGNGSPWATPSYRRRWPRRWRLRWSPARTRSFGSG